MARLRISARSGSTGKPLSLAESRVSNFVHSPIKAVETSWKLKEAQQSQRPVGLTSFCVENESDFPLSENTVYQALNT